MTTHSMPKYKIPDPIPGAPVYPAVCEHGVRSKPAGNGSWTNSCPNPDGGQHWFTFEEVPA